MAIRKENKYVVIETEDLKLLSSEELNQLNKITNKITITKRDKGDPLNKVEPEYLVINRTWICYELIFEIVEHYKAIKQADFNDQEIELSTRNVCFDFYKTFYENNRIAMEQYKNLRKHFNRLVTSVLGKDYYNYGMDVYSADKICCNDIEFKANQTWLERLFRR